MPYYMTQFTYSAETWAGLAKKPEDRTAAIGALLERLGGKLVGLWYSFGEYDGVLIAEAPDNVSVAAAMVAVVGSGATKSTKTTVLLTAKEAVAALKKAGAAAAVYRPPGR
ncbi:MAG: GYD domain-containing protein [Dehalococcoidia bacterium]|nr:GYD domain-containing protein [Dehalococcoidia bacterium]